MGEGHERFEELAVGHVLGGLPQDDAAEFRGHLLACQDCRARVAELRDLADDLAQAEREERHLVRTKTEVARRAEPDDEASSADRAWRWPSRRGWVLIGAVAVVLFMGLGYWNFHLRTVNAELLRVSRQQEQVMQVLAEGQPVPVTYSRGIEGQVRATGEAVAITLTAVPEAAADERLVIWLLGDDGARALPVRGSSISDGRLAWTAPRNDATSLMISLEAWPPDAALTEPAGTELLRGDLTAAD